MKPCRDVVGEGTQTEAAPEQHLGNHDEKDRGFRTRICLEGVALLLLDRCRLCEAISWPQLLAASCGFEVRC
jgi:hypothetical protein